jgi:hypothetical protein
VGGAVAQPARATASSRARPWRMGSEILAVVGKGARA